MHISRDDCHDRFKTLKSIVVNSLVAPHGADRSTREKAERARALRIGLLEAGYNMLAALPPDADLEQQIATLQPDVIIVGEQSDAELRNVVAATANARRPSFVLRKTEAGKRCMPQSKPVFPLMWWRASRQNG